VVDGVAADENELDPDTFYDRLAAGSRVSTAAPGPGRFAAAYEALAAAGARAVLSLHVDARLSGVAQSARLGAAQAPVPVHVVDTGQASFGVAACALEAAAALRGGASALAAAAVARAAGRAVENVFVAPDAPGRGRVEAAGYAAVSLAGGTQRVVAHAGGAADAVTAIVRHVSALDGPLQVAVGHASTATEAPAGELAGALAKLPTVTGVMRYRVAPSVAAHAGAGTFGAVLWRRPVALLH
jgi:fatty acid-binding protein DegV